MAQYENLSEFLKNLRLERGWTQTELATKVGNINSQIVSNWERGHCGPPTHCLQDLIDVLNINRKKLVEVMLLDSEIEIRGRVFNLSTESEPADSSHSKNSPEL